MRCYSCVSLLAIAALSASILAPALANGGPPPGAQPAAQTIPEMQHAAPEDDSPPQGAPGHEARAAGPAAQDSAAQDSAAPPAPAGMMVVPGAFRLSAFSRATFLKDRARLQARYAEIEQLSDSGPGLAQVQMDLAEFYMGHVMGVEARSFLDALDPARLSPRQAARWHALNMALTIEAGGSAPLGPGAPLGAAYADWPDRPLWRVLDAVRMDRPLETPEDLDAAVKRVQSYPEAFQEEALPKLLQLAIDGGRWRMARDLAKRFDAFGPLRQGPAYRFLLGRAAESGGDLVAAFDSYLAAAQGAGIFAIRARLALVEMGLASESLTKEEARDLLEVLVRSWRGDRYALEALQQLAEVEQALDQPVPALAALGQIIADFPGSEAASLARQQARALIAGYYDRGVAGEIPLSQFLEGHRQISLDFRYEPSFAAESERFADRFMAAGASSVAQREYAAVEDTLALERELELQEVPPERLDRLRLKRIEALLAGGQADTARPLVERGIDSGEPDLVKRLSLLKAEVASQLGDTEEVLATARADVPEAQLRLIAEAHFARGEWRAATDAYTRLRAETATEFPFADAIRLLLSAYRGGDRETAAALARDMPELTQIPQWADIAEGLVDIVPEGLPLREATARDRLDRAGATLESLGQIEAAKTQKTQ